MIRVFALNSVIFFATLTASAQQYNISTIAGGTPPPTPVAAVNSPVGTPGVLTTDAQGNVYFASYDCVFKVDPTGMMTRVAGNSRQGFSGDGGAATSAQLDGPAGIAVDSSGNIYISDSNNNRIRKVAANGTITTYAGSGAKGSQGDNGAAISAQLNSPQGLAVDTAGNLYIADSQNHEIRKVTLATSLITTVAGTGTKGYSGDGVQATTVQLNTPNSVAVDNAAPPNLFIADSGNNRVREVTAAGFILTIAGTGSAGFAGDNGSATVAQLNNPMFVALDNSGSVYISDSGNLRVRKVVLNANLIVTAAGGGIGGIVLGAPRGIGLDMAGNLYIADSGNSLVYRTNSGGSVIFAGNSSIRYSLGEGGSAISSQLAQPQGVAIDSGGNVYIADPLLGRVRKISAGNISSVVNTSAPAGVAVDAGSAVYIADSSAHTVLKFFAGATTTVAGTGAPGFSNDGGSATSAQLNQPNGVAVDSQNNVYIADTANNRVRKVTPAGVITTIAGTSVAGFAGDGGSATSAQLNQPYGVAVDSNFNVYIADTGNNRIRKVTLSGIITTYAGNGTPGHSGDSGLAISAGIEAPHGVAFESLGNLYITEGGTTPSVRKVASNGFITTIAGTGVRGYSGDGGPATNAQFSLPWGIAVDANGNVYVTDATAQAVRMLTPVAAAPLSITSSVQLPNGTAGTPYAQALSATGGTPPYSWSVSIGTLPPGLTLSSSGSLTGTPTTAGSAQFTLQVTDSASVTSTKTVAIQISPANPTGLTITSNPTLLSGAIGFNYLQSLIAVGGSAPYTWAVVSGSVPAGLVLSPNGVLSGAPTAAGTTAFTVRVTDSGQSSAIQNFTLTVIAAGTLTTSNAFGHFAAGGPWTTKMYVQNVTSSPVALQMSVYADDGSGLTLPLTLTQQGSAQVVNSSSFTAVLNPNTTFVVDMGTGVANTVTGWISVLSSAPVSGFCIFRTTANGVSSEGTSPLQTQFESRLDLPYDNTAGFVTGVALANVGPSPTTVTATIVDPNGNTLGTQSLTLPANGHTSFLFPDTFQVSAGQQGIVLFQSSGGSLAGVGLRAATATGTFTSVPVVLP